MPTPAERIIRRVPIVGPPIKRGLQLSRLAQKERIRRPTRYKVTEPETMKGGRQGVKEYAKRLEARRKVAREFSRQTIINRAKRLGKK